MGKKAIIVVVLVSLVSIYPSISGNGIKQLEQTDLLFLSHGNETVNVSGCTDISANNYNQNATQDDGSCIYQHLGGYEISESIYVEGMMMGLKYNSNGSKYAILQTDNSPGDGKIVVISTNDSENVGIYEIQLSGFDLPIDFDWSPDGSLFVVMFRNMEIITFDSETGDVSDYLFNLNNSSCQSCYNYVHYGEISYNPDGTLVSVLTKYSSSFYLDDRAYGLVINTSTKEIVKLFSTEYGQSTGTWSPDGTRFALQSNNNLDSIVFFDTETWETVELNIPSNEKIYSMDYSRDGELIAMCSIDKLYVYNTSSLANIWISNISYCWGIDWSSNSDYLGIAQSYNYGWSLTWQSGPEGWEWYSDGSSITIYNTSTGETVDRLTYGNGNVCPTCDYISYLEWHPYNDYIISGGTVSNENYENNFLRTDIWNYNESVEITFGCMEIYSTNFNPNATRSDGSCTEFDEQDINRYRADEYSSTVSDIYYAYWDFCEWSDSEDEFLCWKEDLSALSEDMIDELEDCEQSRNGCETEPYCEEIPYGLWGCTHYIPEYWIPPSSDDEQQSFFVYVDEFGKTVFLLISIIIIFVVMILNMSEKDSRMSKIEIQHHKDGPENEEVIEASTPKSIEINLRELN